MDCKMVFSRKKTIIRNGFFTFNISVEQNVDMEYIELHFRNEIKKLKALLEEISELSNINIRQENSL